MKQFAGRSIGQDGFTMIEIISVLVIIGIVSVVLIARMTSPREYDLDSQVETVKAHLRLAQSRAMNSGRSCGIYFNSATTYYLFDNVAPTTPIQMLGEKNDTVDLGTGGRKSVLTITPPAGTGGRVIFNKFGGLVDSSGNLLTSNMTIETSGKDIIVTKNTGFIP